MNLRISARNIRWKLEDIGVLFKWCFTSGNKWLIPPLILLLLIGILIAIASSPIGPFIYPLI